ncbi:MAG: ATP-binding protein [Actinomycetota bacterium]|nr:ATP-binding protein [Actinomycetota bacterium]MDQ2957011.1 ATP-binding protein [Actinomycetota bacterium]
MDPVRNPYAPGAGQRPPELAGRDAELAAFDVVLERVVRGRAERSVMLTGLRGVGKTVLLNALRSAAVRAGWGTGKLEARPDQSLRRPLSAALHVAVRELGGRQEASDHVLGVLKSFAQKGPSDAKLRDRWQPGIDVASVAGRADSGDIEIDLVELFSDAGGLAADTGRGIALFIDELQDLGAADISALCAACHELSQNRLPLIVVGAGLPHLPAALSASKSYSERLFRYSRIDRLDRVAADRALQAPARDEAVEFTDGALEQLYALTAGYPYFVQAYGKVVWEVAPRSPITEADLAVAAPQAEAELAVGFFGSRLERATPAEREYLHGMAAASERSTADEPESVPTAAVAELLGRKPQSLSPARDALLKKGLIYSGERGRIAFTVPHFGRYLRMQQPEDIAG